MKTVKMAQNLNQVLGLLKKPGAVKRHFGLDIGDFGLRCVSMKVDMNFFAHPSISQRSLVGTSDICHSETFAISLQN